MASVASKRFVELPKLTNNITLEFPDLSVLHVVQLSKTVHNGNQVLLKHRSKILTLGNKKTFRSLSHR